MAFISYLPELNPFCTDWSVVATPCRWRHHPRVIVQRAPVRPSLCFCELFQHVLVHRLHRWFQPILITSSMQGKIVEDTQVIGCTS